MAGRKRPRPFGQALQASCSRVREADDVDDQSLKPYQRAAFMSVVDEKSDALASLKIRILLRL